MDLVATDGPSKGGWPRRAAAVRCSSTRKKQQTAGNSFAAVVSYNGTTDRSGDLLVVNGEIACVSGAGCHAITPVSSAIRKLADGWGKV